MNSELDPWISDEEFLSYHIQKFADTDGELMFDGDSYGLGEDSFYDLAELIVALGFSRGRKAH